MAAEEASTDEKRVKNSDTRVLAPKLAVTAQIQIFEFKIWISEVAGACGTRTQHSTHHIHRVPTLFPPSRHAKRGLQTSKIRKKSVNGSGKQCNSDFWRQTNRYFWNFKFKIASCMFKHTPNISAITFPTTFLTYTTSAEAWKQAQRAKFGKIS